MSKQQKNLRSKLPRFNFLRRNPKKKLQNAEELAEVAPKSKLDKDLANYVEKLSNHSCSNSRKNSSDSNCKNKTSVLCANSKENSFIKHEASKPKINSKPVIPASKSEFWYGTPNKAESSTTKHSATADNISMLKTRPKSALIEKHGDASAYFMPRINNKPTIEGYKKPVVERGLVKERAKIFEQKIEENKKMVEDRKRPRYWEPTVASKAKSRPPIKESTTTNVPTFPRFCQNYATPRATPAQDSNDILVLKLPSSYSGNSNMGWSWASTSPKSTEGELALMHTSSSSNESSNTCKVVKASYSSCALAQRPVFTKSKEGMMSSFTSSGKSSTSPLSEGENKVCDYFDDEIDDQPDLTLNENDQSYRGTPANEFPPTNFPSILSTISTSNIVQKDGGESDAKDLATELFLAGKKKAHEESSLNGSLESLENDHHQSFERSPLDNVESSMKEANDLSKALKNQTMCSLCGSQNNNKEGSLNNNNVQLIQDVISIKSYLQKLRRILHESDDSPVIFPEDSTKFGKNGKLRGSEDEINDLKKQVAALTLQNKEKDRKIAALQRQLDCKTLVTRTASKENLTRLEFSAKISPVKKNGSTQTERAKTLSSSDSANGSHSSSPSGSINGEYRSNTAERCRLRRSRTPVTARAPAPSAVFMSPSPTWSSSPPIFKCSEDGTLRIPIRSTPNRPKTTSGYYTTHKPFL